MKTPKFILVYGALLVAYFFISDCANAQNKHGDDLLYVKVGEKYGFLDSLGVPVVQPQFDKIANWASEGLIAVNKNGKWGFLNNRGEVAIPLQYDWADTFSEGLAGTRTNGKFCFINKQGEEVIELPTTVREIKPFHEGLAAFRVDGGDWEYFYQGIKVHAYGKWGFIDKKGEIVVQPQYYKAENFSCGRAAVCKLDTNNSHWGYINRLGNVIIPLQYGRVTDFSNGFAGVYNNISQDKSGVIDKNGRIVVKGINQFYEFQGGFANVIDFKSKSSFINSYGKLIAPLIYESTHYGFSEGYAAVQIGGKYGFIDKTGKIAISPKFDYAENFSEGYAAVEIGEKWGYINTSGTVIIPLKYEYAGEFSEGYAAVGVIGKKSGYINKKGELVTPAIFGTAYPVYNGIAKVTDKVHVKPRYIVVDSRNDFFKRHHIVAPDSLKTYVKPRVEKAINEWQMKGEFESTTKWKERVNDATREAKAQEFLVQFSRDYAAMYEEFIKQYEHVSKAYFLGKAYIKETECNVQDWRLSPYDADHESFMISGASMDMLLPVGISDAPSFKQNWELIKQTAELNFVPNGDDVALASVTFYNSDKTFTYDGSTEVKYAMTDVDYNFKPLDLSLENANIDFSFNPIEEQEQAVVSTTAKDLRGNSATVERNTVKAVDVSDVDDNIPTTSVNNNRTFAVIIGNENYQKVAKVPFATNDAKVFGEYCQKTLGLPSKNVRYYNDATFANLLSAVDDIESISKAYNGDISVIFYYAGHGVPNEKTGDAYLLPTDADGQNTEVCYPLSRLYRELGAMEARSVVVFMDACFSGSQRSGGMLASARGIALKARKEEPKGNMVVFSASQGDETAYPYTEKGHGLFTYYLLKILQETKGEATLKQLEEFITTNVRQQSVVVNKKVQTPSVMSSGNVGSDWGKWKLK